MSGCLITIFWILDYWESYTNYGLFCGVPMSKYHSKKEVLPAQTELTRMIQYHVDFEAGIYAHGELERVFSGWHMWCPVTRFRGIRFDWQTAMRNFLSLFEFERHPVVHGI